MLRIPDANKPNAPDGSRFVFHVDHPGIRPRLIYRGARAEILSFAKAVLSNSLQEGISVATLDGVLRTVIMPYAKEMMATRLAEAAPGVKEHGTNPFS